MGCYYTMRWILCFLFLIVVVGCATPETTKTPPPPPPKIPEMVEPQREPAVLPVVPAAPVTPDKKEPDVFKTAPEPDLPTETVRVTVNRLNLRAENSTRSQILSVVKKNEHLTVMARYQKWINVRSASGIFGWVAERYTAAVPGQAKDQ